MYPIVSLAGRILLVVLLLAGSASAQDLDLSEFVFIFELLPNLQVFLTAAIVLTTAKGVRHIVDFVKKRLKNRFGDDLPHLYIYGASGAVCLCVSIGMHFSGALGNDPIFGPLPSPFDILVYAVALMATAGGWFDGDKAKTETPERPNPPANLPPPVIE